MFWSWFPAALAATVCFGISAAFYKLPAVKGHSRIASTFWFLATSEALALLFFFRDLGDTNEQAVLLGLVAGAGFALVTMVQMYALTHVDTNSLFPVTTTLSLVLAVSAGLVIFNERPTVFEVVGIVLAATVVFLFSRKDGKWQFSPLVLGLTFCIPVMSAIFKIVQKMAADAVNIRTFQIYAYLFGALFALIIYLVFAATTAKPERRGFFGAAMKWGSLNGVFGFLGGVFVLTALTRGPFALITPIQSLYVIVTALIGHVLFREQLGARKWMLILLSVAAVGLMSAG